ncbi:MAG: hypothetical protein RM347_029090 [Nostoc sp. ChiQUE02]|nr:hypothetical protein [Nostoc sp. ChiQUE02]MDZ8233334.1 hypothetical protein [Nostoc sp. ChiQUE02]
MYFLLLVAGNNTPNPPININNPMGEILTTITSIDPYLNQTTKAIA